MTSPHPKHGVSAGHGLTRFVIVALIVAFTAIAVWGAYRLTVESSNEQSLTGFAVEHGQEDLLRT